MSSAEVENPSFSLLSLSIAAANAAPIPVPQSSVTTVAASFSPGSYNGVNNGTSGSHAITNKVHSALKHRRLSSTGQVKRRMSDAREAATRPSAASLQNSSAALNALATLSLAGSPPPQAPPQTATSFASAVGAIRSMSSEMPDDYSVKQEDQEQQEATPLPASGDLSVSGITIKKNGTGKKRGTIFQCESCSKVYRHPSCLIKHRWEHTPQWREASKLMLSKHQQVQHLEAAAILSHLAPSNNGGNSLPEDRSLWPSFLSGGLLPPPSTMTRQPSTTMAQPQTTTVSSYPATQAYRVSSSVPIQSALSLSRPGSTGPRMHDYSIPSSSGITQVRPGVVTVSTGTSPAHTPAPTTAPLPVNRDTYRDKPRGVSVSSDAWESPVSSAFGNQSYGTTGSWSLPRSSVRSRSTSSPKSDEDENGYVEIDIEGEEAYAGQNFGFISRGRTSATRSGFKDEEDSYIGIRGEKIDEEWDGELEMEM